MYQDPASNLPSVMSRHTRGKNSFSVKWLTLKDGNGDELSDYILKTETDFSVRCDWCKKTFSIENSGKTQIFQHAKTTGHKEIADIRKGRKTGQARFVPSSEVSLEKENNNNIGFFFHSPLSTSSDCAESFAPR